MWGQFSDRSERDRWVTTRYADVGRNEGGWKVCILSRHIIYGIRGDKIFISFLAELFHTACADSHGDGVVSDSSSIYYHREALCYSLDRLRVDLITVSSRDGMLPSLEPRFDSHLFPDRDVPRCMDFAKKRVRISGDGRERSHRQLP